MEKRHEDSRQFLMDEIKKMGLDTSQAKKGRRKRVTHPSRKRKRTRDEDEEWIPPRSLRPRRGDEATGNDRPQSGDRRYPKRDIPRVDYAGILESLEDEFDEKNPEFDFLVHCDKCNEMYADECPTHPFIVVFNEEMNGGDARHTVPWCVYLDESTIPEAGLGVFAKTFLPKNVRFGPYWGIPVDEEDYKKDADSGKESGYAWQVKNAGMQPYFVDGVDIDASNWMRYVNCARSKFEQNVAAFQYKGAIFYKTTRAIEEGEELFVYYGEEYALLLGIEDFDRPLKHANGGRLNTEVPKENRYDVRQSQVVSHQFNGNRLSKHNRLRKRSITGRRRDEAENCASNDNDAGGKCVDQQGLDDAHEGRNELLKNKEIVNHTSRLNAEATSMTVSSKCKRSGCVRTRTSERQFPCKSFKTAFSRSSNLQTHMRTHAGDRPFPCKSCGKAFAESGTLKTHMRTHTGDRPYQ